MAGLERDVRGAAAHIEERFAAGEPQRRDRRRAPASIDAGAEEMIEQIVAGGDRIEHSGDAIRGFVRRCRHSSKVQRHGGREEVDDPDVSVQVERLLHLRQVVVADQRLFVREQHRDDA